MIIFTIEAWDHYIYWQNNDRKKLEKINELVKDTLRSPFAGLGKPEPLKNNLSGFWSRRIDGANRLVYKFENNNLTIISCKFHY
ncbi:MAG: Txe/YoeB family addiction module toxin [Spirochaetes bacterium]|nr:Txe/YoeB family addiction module toxin [Spirochaetota bacterium]